MASSPRDRLASAGLRAEFEALQALRTGIGLQDHWKLRHLPPRLKTLLTIATDTNGDLSNGVKRLHTLVNEMPPDIATHLRLCFNFDTEFGNFQWMERTDTFGESQNPTRAGRTVRKACDDALQEFLTRLFGEGTLPAVTTAAADTQSIEVAVTSSPREYKGRILAVESDASTIDRVPKRVSVVFKDEQTVIEIAEQRFGEGSASIEHYVTEHRLRRKQFLDALAEGSLRCREIYNKAELLAYVSTRKHGKSVDLSPAAMARTIKDWIDAIEGHQHYFVGLTEDPLPFKYQIVNAVTVSMHEAIGTADSHRLNGLLITSAAVAQRFQQDFEVIWDRIAPADRTRARVVEWLRTTLLPELGDSEA